MLNKFLFIFFLVFSTSIYAQGERIPRSAPDKGKYYVISVDNVKGRNLNKMVIYNRVGVYDESQTKLEVNCGNMQAREYGNSDVGFSKEPTTNWFDLISGSAKWDVAKYICLQYIDD